VDQEHVVATGSGDELPDLKRMIRERHPRASFLAALSIAQREYMSLRTYDVWLDETAGVLLVLEHIRSEKSRCGKADELLLHRLPLRSPACGTMVDTLAWWPLDRLDSAAESDTFAGLLTALGALEQLFRIHLVHLRLVHPGPAEVDRAIRDQIARADSPEQERRRVAFRDWHLHEVCDWPDHLTSADAARAVGLRPDDLAGVVGSWHTYQDEVFDRPVIDDWWRKRRRGRRELHYYEFRALDRPLTDRQVAILAKVLPEGRVRRDRAVIDIEVVPAYENFRWTHDELLAAYFDAGLYFCQSGWRTLWLRVPAALADAIEPYRRFGAVDVTDLGEDLIVELERVEEDGELTYMGTDPGPWLAEMLPVRDELARGDLRALHIAWTAADIRDFREPTSPPAPEPPGLDDLTPGLAALRHFLTHIP
jgi:hypothetical protein